MHKEYKFEEIKENLDYYWIEATEEEIEKFSEISFNLEWPHNLTENDLRIMLKL